MGRPATGRSTSVVRMPADVADALRARAGELGCTVGEAHVVVTEAPGFARCGANVDGDEVPARSVPERDRCQASGCRGAWPADLRVVG